MSYLLSHVIPSVPGLKCLFPVCRFQDKPTFGRNHGCSSAPIYLYAFPCFLKYISLLETTPLTRR